MITNEGTVAREYLRVSHDRSGRERSITEQQNDNRAAWPAWSFNGPYSDVSISASRYSTKARGGYAELTGDLAAGRFGAEVLVLWESSRGSRRVGEWVDLIELAEAAGVRIAVTSHGRIYDPANARDRRSLLEDAVDSEYESAKISGRAKRATAANAAEGRPHGAVPYGYRRTYDPSTGRLASQDVEPAEAAVVAEVFDRIAAGHSLRSIAADLDGRGIRARSGKALHSSTLRCMLQRPLYAGQRSHAPGVMTFRERRLRETIVEATWPAIVPKATFLAVQRIMSDPARKTTRPGSGVHLLSMIGRCDVCAGPLTATTRRRNTREYQCHKGGHVRVDADALDALAEAVMLAYLSRPDNVERLTADERGDDDLDAVRVEIATVRVELDSLADQLGRGEISATLAARAEPAILARLKAAEGREAELSTPSALRGLVGPGDDVEARWRSAPMAARREVARLLLSPEVLGELRVTRSTTPGHRCPIVDRVAWRR